MELFSKIRKIANYELFEFCSRRAFQQTKGKLNFPNAAKNRKKNLKIKSKKEFKMNPKKDILKYEKYHK